jgi:hypothetical protein
MRNLRSAKLFLSSLALLTLGAHSVSAFGDHNLINATEYGANNNNFTFVDPSGGHVGGTNLVRVHWDGTLNTDVNTAVTNMSLHSDVPFHTLAWSAHDVKVYGPGTYTIETCPAPIDINGIAADGSDCSKSPNPGGSNPVTMIVGPNQLGVHMMFNWGAYVNIDVLNVWEKNSAWLYGPNDNTNKNVLEAEDTVCIAEGQNADLGSRECVEFFATEWLYTSCDVQAVGIPGIGMSDGPFPGFRANFNIQKQMIFDDALTATMNESAKTEVLTANDTLPATLTAGVFTISDFDATTEQGGSVTANGDNTFNYLPPVNFTGHDSFTYQVDDGIDHSEIHIGVNGHYKASARVDIEVVEAVASAVTPTTETESVASSGTTVASSDSSGSLFALPLMFILLPLRLISLNKKQ